MSRPIAVSMSTIVPEILAVPKLEPVGVGDTLYMYQAGSRGIKLESVNLPEHFDAVLHYGLPGNPNRLVKLPKS